MPDPPEYKVYRSRRRPLRELRAPADLQSLRERRRRGPRPPSERRGVPSGRIFKWAAAVAGAWLLLSLLLFVLSAQLEEGISDRAKAALSGEGSLLTGSTILVLGSDQRTGESIDRSQTGPPRADSIMLLHAAFGSVRKLSIPRDSFTEIPGHGSQKINSAYAIGGAALMIQTVQRFMGNGLKVNHVIEVDFEEFPELIDALGGITVDVERKICSPPFDNFWKGLTFRAGKQKLDGTKALGFARVRKNSCAPNETDLDRARRQQQVMSAIRRRLVSPTTFLRLPLVSWRAPKSINTDMRAPALMGLFSDLVSGGTGDPMVLEASCLSCGPGNSVIVSDGAKEDAVRKLVEG